MNLYSFLGWPNEIAIALFFLVLAVALAPYISDVDFHVIRIPKLPEALCSRSRHWGPLAVIICLAGFFPWPHDSNVSATLDAYTPDPNNTGASKTVLQPDSWNVDETHLSYSVEKNGKATVIYPEMGYLNRFKNGGPIRPLSVTRFKWNFPTLDVKLVNNSSKTIYLTDAVFNVRQSRLDPAPLLVVHRNRLRANAWRVPLYNYGSGIASNLRMRFHLTPLFESPPSPNYSAPFAHEVHVGDVERRAIMSLAPAFIKMGVDVESLKALPRYGRHQMSTEEFEAHRRQFLGPFTSGRASLSGELVFTSKTLSGKTKKWRVQFSAIVQLFNRKAKKKVRLPTREYDVKLDSENVNYLRRVPISHVLEPGESDRFTLMIAVDRSSYHSFVLELMTSENEVFDSFPVRLHAVIPRSQLLKSQQVDMVGSESE